MAAARRRPRGRGAAAGCSRPAVPAPGPERRRVGLPEPAAV